jgi:hypothetical protein
VTRSNDCRFERKPRATRSLSRPVTSEDRLPFSCPFGATESSKGRQAQTQSEGRKSLISTGNDAGFRQRLTHDRKKRLMFLFRLLTGGLLVRIQPEEPLPRLRFGRVSSCCLSGSASPRCARRQRFRIQPEEPAFACRVLKNRADSLALVFRPPARTRHGPQRRMPHGDCNSLRLPRLVVKP